MHKQHLAFPRRATPGRTRALWLATALAASAWAAPALAADYSGTGIVESTGPVDGNVQPFLASSNGGYTFAGSSGWSLYAPFLFDATGIGNGNFTLVRGNAGLSGNLNTQLVGTSSFSLTYTVLSGTGQFAGATGGGTTLVTLTDAIGPEMFRYSEVGQISVVPEPAAWALLLGGAALLAARRGRLGAAAPAGPSR